jgi:hypothetical protein
MTLTIVGRQEWGARHEAGDGPAPLPAREVWLHHSVTVAPDMWPPFGDEDAAMRQLEWIGEQRFGRGVSYTFAVMPTGRVYEGHGVGTLGAHTAKRNGVARAIVLVGNYDDAEPTAEQLEAAAQLLAHGWRAGWWTTPKLNGGHRQAPGASTACPGRHGLAAVDQINARAAQLTAAAGTPSPAPDDDEDETVRYLAYRSDPNTVDPHNRRGNGAIAIAAPGQWYVVPSPAYWQLLRARGATAECVNVPHNEWEYLRAVFLEPELNDAQLSAAVAGVAGTVQALTDAG